MPKFKIFYSWQSDLPGNKTRNFIRDCIDDAIALVEDSEAIEAIRDEATKDTTGSPNIVTTLFSKIDECDLFIADVSLCFTGDVEKEKAGKKIVKHSPNPNVLLELGYAVKTLTWERVICLCNTDFGADFPFDFAQNRRTCYSLEGKTKADVRREVVKTIFRNIQKLKDQVPRAKAGMAAHKIGAYDLEQQIVTGKLVAFEIGKSDSYMLHNRELLEECKELFDGIQSLSNKMKKTEAEERKIKTAIATVKHTQLPTIDNLQMIKDAVHLKKESYKESEAPVVWTDKDIDKEWIEKWLNVPVDDSFFDLYGLTRVVQITNQNGASLSGTDDEKKKYDQINALLCKLALLEARTNYLKTFEGMNFIPLAIQNCSDTKDTDIRIVVYVETGEAVDPDEHLICPDYDGIQGLFCRNDEDENDIGVIAELFILPEDGVIHIEDEPWYPTTPKIPILTGRGFQQPDKTEDDYKTELKEFIASTEGLGYYEFDVSSLRPRECRWLSKGMLIKPATGKVILRYRIHSSRSSGDLNGRLEVSYQ